MKGFILRVSAFYGLAQDIAGPPARAGWSHDSMVVGIEVVNDPAASVFRTRSERGGRSHYYFDVLIDDFEQEFACKVSFMPGEPGGGLLELEIFEPNWDDSEEAIDVINELNDRVHDWITGKLPQLADGERTPAASPAV
jgi:hypothetical protein